LMTVAAAHLCHAIHAGASRRLRILWEFSLQKGANRAFISSLTPVPKKTRGLQ
jgi:hypothetical protein